MAIFLIAVIDIKRKFISISEENQALKQNISDLLYSYNKTKLANVIKMPEFAMLLRYFLNQRNIIEKVVKNKDNREVILAYSELIQLFKSM